MRVTTGVDIVHIPTFKESLDRGEGLSHDRLFTPSEMERGNEPHHLAGVFAAKESVMKALNMPHKPWKDIEISNDETGKPHVHVENDTSTSSDISITHHGEYALAFAVFIYD